MADQNQSSNTSAASLAQAIIAIKEGERSRGLQLLDNILQTDPDNVTAWLWKSAAVDSDDERRACLEQILRINPAHPQALRGLQKLGVPAPDLSQPEQEAEMHTAELQEELPTAELQQEQPSTEPPQEEQPSSEPPQEQPDEYSWPFAPESDAQLGGDLPTPHPRPDNPLGDVDVDAYFSSFNLHTSGQAAPGQGESRPAGQPAGELPIDAFAEGDDTPSEQEASLPTFEWRFNGSGVEEPAPSELEGIDESAATPGGAGASYAPEDAVESLDRFLGIEPAHGNLRGFKDSPSEPTGEAVPAFIFDEEADQEAALAQALAAAEGEPLEAAGEDAGETRVSILPRMWANPGGKPNCVCILREEYLILANPDPLFIDRIRDEVSHGEVKKRSLGRSARPIPLKSILRLTCEPDGTSFDVTYKEGRQRLHERAEFASIEERDNAVEALAELLQPGFDIREQATTRLRAVLPPVILVTLVFILLGLLAAIEMRIFAASAFGKTLASVQDILRTPLLDVPVLDSIPLVLILALLGLLLLIIGLFWLYARLRQPLRLIVLTCGDSIRGSLSEG